MNILITGAKGQLGSALQTRLQADHQVTGVDIDTLDIVDFTAVQATVAELQPDVILNCAAWTDVDACANDPEKAILSNGYGAQNLAVAAYAIGAAIVQISSNEVFDGKHHRPYYEYDMPNPINPYGYSKYVGEQSVRATNPRHYIVRTSWLFAHGGRNFIQAILGAAQAGKSLRVVTDEIANPTYTDDLATAIVALLATGRYGTYHLANEGSVSRWQFARYVLDTAGMGDLEIARISSHEWQRASMPPVYSGLANLSAKRLGITLRDWQAAVDAFLAQEGAITAT